MLGLHFNPTLHFTLSLQSAFYPWSAVQSAVRSLRFTLTGFENEDRSTKHPNLENGAPKTRKRSTQNSKTKHPNLQNEDPKLENEAPESGGGSGCVRTSKGPQNPSQGFIKACQLFN